jgi:alpha-ketoglutarate-dependent taurine dioxygenase/protein-arginine kinase activator protein McsA
MFYKESEKLLAELPTREQDIRDFDEFLHSHGGEVIYAKKIEFTLELPGGVAERLLKIYETEKVLERENRARCHHCKDEFAEFIFDTFDRKLWKCDACGETFEIDCLSAVECYRVKKSPKPKLLKREEKEMQLQDRINHGKVAPWKLLPEGDYLRSVTTFGAADQDWVLDRLQRQGFCLLRGQGMSPSKFQLQAIEEFLGPAFESQNGAEGKVKSINPSEAFAANTGDSSKELAFHTDGTQENTLPPALLVFQYETTPSWGGTSTFLDLTSLLLDLTDEEQLLIIEGLSLPDAAVCEKKGLRYEGPLVKPVCADQALSFRLRFDDKITVSPAAKQAYDLLLEKILAQTKYLKYMPHEGDIAIFDNWRVLHGRKSVEGGRHLRFHNRMWIKELDDRHQGKYLLGVRGLSPELIATVRKNNRV